MPTDNTTTQMDMDNSYFSGNGNNRGRNYYDNNSMPQPNSSQPSLTPNESPQMVGAPQTAEQAYLGSFESALQDNLGFFVIIEFLIGTNGLTEKEGILYSVGNNFVTLYEQETDRYIVCDLYSVKFVTFFRQRPSSGRGNRLGYEASGNNNYGGMVPMRY